MDRTSHKVGLKIPESTSPDTEAGQVRPDGDVITLAAGAQVTLIDPDGETTVGEGPCSGAIKAAIGQPYHSTMTPSAPMGDFPTLDPDSYEAQPARVRQVAKSPFHTQNPVSQLTEYES